MIEPPHPTPPPPPARPFARPPQRRTFHVATGSAGGGGGDDAQAERGEERLKQGDSGTEARAAVTPLSWASWMVRGTVTCRCGNGGRDAGG